MEAQSLYKKLSTCLLIFQLFSSPDFINAQHLAQTKSLETVLLELEKTYDVTISYKTDLLAGFKVETQQLNTYPDIESKLAYLLNQHHFKYEKIDKNAFVVLSATKGNTPVNGNDQNKYSVQSESNPILNISGKVTFDTGEPFSGVTILIKGSNKATATDINGNYSLQAPSNAILLFSSVGFITKSLAVESRTSIHVKMSPSITTLGEIVISGTIRTGQKRQISGAVESLEMKNINFLPHSSIESFLQGKATGVQVVNNSGTPGGDIYVRVRGNASLIGMNRPLYVVDGLPLLNTPFSEILVDYIGNQRSSSMSFLNSDDIQSLEILKDAAAISMYGARGANGVVLINTKRGHGKLKINFDSYFGLQKVVKKMNLLDAYQYADYAKGAIKNANVKVDTLVEHTGYNTDWQDAIFRIAPMQNQCLSLSGSDSLTNYYGSINYFSQQGIIIGSDFSRATGRFSIDHPFSKKFKISTSLGAFQTNNNRIPDGIAVNAVLGSALVRNPNLPVFTPGGAYSDDPAGIPNPVKTANDAKFKQTKKRITGIVNLNYKILENFQLNSTLATDQINSQELFQEDTATYPLVENGKEYLYRTENTLSFSKEFNDKHELSSLAGWSLEKSSFKTSYQSRSFSGDVNSFFGKLKYSYKNKYTIVGTLRTDGSTRYGTGITYGVFPSVSTEWNAIDETNTQKKTFVDYLKFRLSHGATGSQDVFINFTDKGIPIGLNGKINQIPGADKLPDANLKWERTSQTDVGCYLSMFRNRMNITADIYYKASKNLLTGAYVKQDSVYQNISMNLGTMTNKGLELSIVTNNLKQKLTWTTAFSISFNENKIKAISRGEDPTAPEFIGHIEAFHNVNFNAPQVYSTYLVGQSYGAFYGYVFQGVDVNTGKSLYKDLNGDGKITNKDQTVIGNPLPKNFGALDNHFSYKNLELDFSFVWSNGNQVYNETRAILDNMASADKQNASTDVLNRWKNPGDVTHVPKAIIGTGGAENTLPSSRWVEDGSYLKLRSITVSYKLPDKLSKHLWLSNVKVFISSQNLFTLTPYLGYDPEAQNHANRNLPTGVDWITYPSAKTCLGGIHIEI